MGWIELSLQSRAGDWEDWGGLVRTECEPVCKEISGCIHYSYRKMDLIGPVKVERKQATDQRGGTKLME